MGKLRSKLSSKGIFLGATRSAVKFDSNTKVGVLFCALPSCMQLLRRFGISIDLDADLTLLEVSAKRCFSLDELMRSLQGLTSGEESCSSS